MPLDPVLLVEEAVRRTGGRGALARELGIESYGEDRVGRWVRGENSPRYEETIALLEIVGWLDNREISRALSAQAAQEAEDAAPVAAEVEARSQDEHGVRTRGARKTAGEKR